MEEAPPDPAARDAMRASARDAHGRGNLADAIEIQRKLLASGPAEMRDSMSLDLLLFAARDLTGGIAAMREALAAFPNEPALHEDLSVFLIAAGDYARAAEAARQSRKQAG